MVRIRVALFRIGRASNGVTVSESRDERDAYQRTLMNELERLRRIYVQVKEYL